jgi:hypothetical protein
VVDTYNIGRVQVIIEDLGFYTAEEAIWAHPRQTNGMIIPKLGSYVDVYFIKGDSGKPVYGPPCSEIQGMVPENWKGVTKDAIIFEHPSDSSWNIQVKSGKLILFDGEESMVLGDQLKSDLQKLVDALTQLNTDFTSWTPVPNDGGAALKTLLGTGFLLNIMPTLSKILSLLIKVK